MERIHFVLETCSFTGELINGCSGASISFQSTCDTSLSLHCNAAKDSVVAGGCLISLEVQARYPDTSGMLTAVTHATYGTDSSVREWAENSRYIPHKRRWQLSLRVIYPYIPWKILRPCGRQWRQAERKDRRQHLRRRGTQSSKLPKLGAKLWWLQTGALKLHSHVWNDSCMYICRLPGVVRG